MALKNLIQEIKDTFLVPFDDDEKGFIVELGYIPKPMLKKLGKQCMLEDYKNHSPVKELDSEKFDLAFAKKAVKSWKGLTPQKFCELVPEMDKAGLLASLGEAKEIAFNEEALELLLEYSTSFMNFMGRYTTDLKALQDDALKN